MIPRILLDENCMSKKLKKLLEEYGFTVESLPQGTDDNTIIKFMHESQNHILITSDVQLSCFFSHKFCFYVEHDDTPKVKAHLIKHYMSQFT